MLLGSRRGTAFSKLGGSDAELTFEHGAHVFLVLEPCPLRYVCERQAGSDEELLGAFDALLHQFLLDGSSEERAKAALQHTAGNPGLRRDLAHTNPFACVLPNNAESCRHGPVINGQNLG